MLVERDGAKGKGTNTKWCLLYGHAAFLIPCMLLGGCSERASMTSAREPGQGGASGEEPSVVTIEVGDEVLSAVGQWDTNIWFFTSRNDPLRTLDGLAQEDIACWGGELCQNVLQFREAIGIPTIRTNLGVHVIGVGPRTKIDDLKPYGHENSVRLFITWSQFASNLIGEVRVVFADARE